MPTSSPVYQLSQQLLRIDEAGLSSSGFLTKVEVLATVCSKMLITMAAEFLSDEIDDTKHTEKQVKQVIDAVPEALSVEHVATGSLPIACAATRLSSLSFVPLLAQEGCRRIAGGEETRGGLLIRTLGHISMSPDEKKALQIFKNLEAMGLLLKEDVRGECLFRRAFVDKSKLLFEFLADLDPDALWKPVTGGGVPPFIHFAILWGRQYQDSFETVLKSSMKHFPNEMGLLFVSFEDKTAIEAAIHWFGEHDTMEIIRRHIPPSKSHPILHHIIKHTPQLMNLFSRHYPDATYLRDIDNRTLFLTTLAKCNKTFDKDPMFFLQATDHQVAEMDPVTELFPFALAASDDTSDLEAVYKLLRRDPGLVFGKSGMNKRRNRKRKNVE